MDDNIQKYDINYKGKFYILTTEIYLNNIRITCSEQNNSNSLDYTIDLSFESLKQLSTAFHFTLTIKDAQDLINKMIEEKKIEIQNLGNTINLILYLYHQNENAILPLNPNLTNMANTTYIQQNIPTEKIINPPIYSQDPLQQTADISLTEQGGGDIYDQNNFYEPKSVVHKMPQNDYYSISQTQAKSQDVNPGNYNSYIVSNMIDNNEIISKQEKIENDINNLNTQVNQLINQINFLNQNYRNTNPNQIIYQIPNSTDLNDNNILKKENNKNPAETTNLNNIDNIANNNNYSQENNNQNNNNYHLINNYEQNQINNNNKEEELSFYKAKIEELENEKDKTIRENNNLKSQINNLLNNNNMYHSPYQNLLKSQSIHQNKNAHIIQGDIFENNEMEFVFRKLCFNYGKINIDLIYKATVDSDEAYAFHQKCDSAEHSIVLVESGNGKRFGGFTFCNWRGNSIMKKDDYAFIFSLDKMKIYEVIPGEDAIGCFPQFGPIFAGCQIKIYDNAFKNGGSTFERGKNYYTNEDYELTGGIKEFVVKDIEVYSVILE